MGMGKKANKSSAKTTCQTNIAIPTVKLSAKDEANLF
jgi:hypothetical protein